jgi:hypothetical protein
MMVNPILITLTMIGMGEIQEEADFHLLPPV